MNYDELAHRYLLAADALRQIARHQDEPRAHRIASATLEQLKRKPAFDGSGTNPPGLTR